MKNGEREELEVMRIARRRVRTLGCGKVTRFAPM